MCAAMPTMIFQVVLYRQNLVMATEKFPAAPVFTGDDRLLVLAPHCDDETLGVGGTLAAAREKGAAVRIVFLTNGDSSMATQIAEDARHLRRNTFHQLVTIRQREAVAAMKAVGVDEKDVTFLGYPDGGTKAMWEENWSYGNPYRSAATGANKTPYANSRTVNAAYCGEQALRDVREVIEEFQPTAIFTTHPGDTHGDHWAAYAYANTALQSLRIQQSTQAWAKQTQLLTFLVHHGPWPVPHGYHPDASLSPPAALKDSGTHWVQMPLDEQSRAAKKAALESYVSQLPFTPHYLRSFLRRNELLGIIAHRTLDAASQPVRESKSIQPPPLIRDPAQDTLLNDVWKSADLKSVSFERSGDGVMLRTELSQQMSPRLAYRFSFHTVAAEVEPVRTEETIVGASTLTVRHGDKGLWATLKRAGAMETTARPLSVSRTVNGFEIQIPHDMMPLSKMRTLLVSASTHLGNRTLDQTELGTLRVVNPA